jgi:hypothetical protein
MVTTKKKQQQKLKPKSAPPGITYVPSNRKMTSMSANQVRLMLNTSSNNKNKKKKH